MFGEVFPDQKGVYICVYICTGFIGCSLITSCVLPCILFIALFCGLAVFFVRSFLLFQQGRALKLLPNPQTDELLSLLGLEHVVTVPSSGHHGVGNSGAVSLLAPSVAITEEPSFDESTGYPFEVDVVGAGQDPNEIELDD